MNYLDKTKEELISELQDLQHKHNSLKVLYDADRIDRRQADKDLLLAHMSVESASDALYWMKPDGRIVNVNEAACCLLGYTREELLQLSVPDVDVHYNVEVWSQHFLELKKYGSLKFESDQRTKDGRIIPVEIVANYVQFEDEEYNCAFVRDISERKVADQRQFSIFNQSPIAIEYYDADGCLLDVNDACLALFGVINRNEISGFKLFGDPNITNDIKTKLQNKEQVRFVSDFNFEEVKRLHLYQTSCSGIKILEWLITPLTDATGVVIGYIEQIQDVTERKLAEEALQESEEKFRSLYNTMDQGFALHQIITDDNGKPIDYLFLDINDSYTRLLGVTREMGIGKRITDVMPKIEQYWIDVFGKVALTGESCYFENYLETTGKFYSTYSYCPKKNQFAVLFNDISERKLGEEKLNENNTLLRIAGVKAKLGGWSIDLEQNRVIWSDEVAAIHEMPAGYSPLLEDALGFYAPEWCEKITNCFAACAQNGTPYDEELEVITSSKKRVWVRAMGEAIRNSEGKIFKVQGAFQDITERKLAEEALRESENRFRALFEKGPIGVAYHEMVYDDAGKAIDYRFLDANSSYIELTGVDPRGKLVTQAFPGIEKDPFDWIGTFGHVASSGEQIRLEQYLQVNNRWYDCVGYQFKPGHFVAAFMEITERKQAEELLKKSEERFKKMFNEAPLGIAVIDSLTGRIFDINPMFAKIAGRTMAEMKDIDLMSITHPDDIQAEHDNMARMNAGKTTGFTMEKRYLPKDGSPVWINMTIAPLNVEDKTRPHHFCMIEDITERKQSKQLLIANKELAFQNEEKEKRSSELVIANKELESFSYSVSHDLRAPLRHIDGYVDLLLSRYYESLPDKARHYLDNIADSSRQMGKLIDDLLQFSRTGRQALHLAEVDMNSIIGDVLEPIKRDVASRDIEWHIAHFPHVLADQALLRLVWTNLLSNAVKFTGTRPKAIIEINVLDENNTFVFSIRDNGVGFDMQYAQNLFGVFQRLHPDREFEGTGIGLANVQQIITKHGGRTWAEAVPDQGATFYFSLPK